MCAYCIYIYLFFFCVCVKAIQCPGLPNIKNASVKSWTSPVFNETGPPQVYNLLPNITGRRLQMYIIITAFAYIYELMCLHENTLLSVSNVDAIII